MKGNKPVEQDQTNPSISINEAIVGGIAGGAAYLAAMGLDILATREPTNDLRLLAGMVPRGEKHWAILGTLIHFFNSISLGLLFARVRDWVPGTGWRQGVLFALVENIVLAPGFIAIDRVHPAVRAGRLPRYGRVIPFLQQVIRHIAYGAALGALLGRKR